MCKAPYTDLPRKFLSLIAGLGCSTACLAACASCLALTHFNLGCGVGKSGTKPVFNYFGHNSKEIPGHRKIWQKIPWVANLQEFRLPVMPSIWARKESIKSLWNIQNGNVMFPSESTKPHPLSWGRWKVMRKWQILGDMKIWLPLSCAMQYHFRIGQIIEHPCSACSCVYYWCNWKPSQKEDEKKKKKESKRGKTTRFSFGLRHLGHFISEQVGICLGLVCIETSSEMHLLFIQALGLEKAKGLCKPPVGISRSSLRHFLYQLPMPTAHSIRERESRKDFFVREWIPLNAWLWAALV